MRYAVRCLVVAKAPLPGLVKTRLGARIGMDAAAEVAAAALLDTLAACAEAFGPAGCLLALDGKLDEAVDGDAIAARLRDWTVFGQRGADLGSRLADAHRAAGPGPVMQIGMDTPQVESGLLHAVAVELDHHEAVLGPAEDGGWWVLGLRDPGAAAALAGVPMSTPDTHRRTRAALGRFGLVPATASMMRDVDTVDDAVAVAVAAPETRFARAWARAVGVPA